MPSQNDFTRNPSQWLRPVSVSSPLLHCASSVSVCVCGWAQKHKTHTSVNLHRYANAA